MNWFERVALAAVVVVTWYLSSITAYAWNFYIVQRDPPFAMTALAVAGWVLSNYMPLGIALLFWRLSKRAHRPWLVHLLVLPVMLGIMWVGDAMMLFVMDQPDFDTMIGAPVLPGSVLFFLGVGGYVAAVIAGSIAHAREQAHAT